MFDLFSSPKERKRNRIKQNVRKGSAAERDAVNSDALFGGWESKRTGKGHDFEQIRQDWITGKPQKRYKEVKSGNAKLSKLQKKTMAKMKKNGVDYVVDRRDPFFY
nr:hypothetical protein [Nanoarchaeum sp.]